MANPARNFDVSLGGFNNVQAQEADSIEVGIKAMLGDVWYVELAAYTVDVEDEIVSLNDIGNRVEFENADTDRQGFELSAVAQFSEGLRLSLAYTYADFEFDDFPSNPAFEGNDLPGLPEHQLYAELAYRHDTGFYLVTDVQYVDELYANNANAVTSDDYTVANLRLGYEGGQGRWRWGPFLGINNLFDEEYNSNVRINGFGGRLFEPAPERNLYAGFTLGVEMR